MVSNQQLNTPRSHSNLPQIETQRLKFSPLCFTNHAPSEAQTQSIRKLIFEGKNVINWLDMEIRRQPPPHDGLRTQRDNVQLFIDCHKTILSPVRRLPPEIITEFFQYFISSVDLRSNDPFPWRLGHICKSWRSVALSIKPLWASFHLTWHHERSDNAHRRLRSLMIYSDSYPMAFSLSGRITDFAIVIEILLRRSNYWGKVALSNLSPASFEILAKAKGNVACLKHLSLSRCDDPPCVIDIFGVAPQLTCLELEDTPNPEQTFTFPWSQLKYFKSHRNHFDTESGLIQQLYWTPNLEILDVWIESGNQLKEVLDPLELPVLHTLRFRGICSDLDAMVRSIIAPSLRTLDFCCPARTQAITHQTQVAELFSTQSFSGEREAGATLSGITHLLLRDVPKSTALALLEIIPMLESLTITLEDRLPHEISLSQMASQLIFGRNTNRLHSLPYLSECFLRDLRAPLGYESVLTLVTIVSDLVESRRRVGRKPAIGVGSGNGNRDIEIPSASLKLVYLEFKIKEMDAQFESLMRALDFLQGIPSVKVNVIPMR